MNTQRKNKFICDNRTSDGIGAVKIIRLIAEIYRGEVLEKFADRLGNAFPPGECCLFSIGGDTLIY